MDRRRNGLIALVVLVTAVVALIYLDRRPAPEPTTAFAPAQSADESVAPSDTPILPPDDTAAAAEDVGEAAAVPPSADEGAEADVAALPTAPQTAAPSSEADEAATADLPAEVDTEADPSESEIAMTDPAADLPSAAEPVAPPVAEAELPPVAVPTFDVVRVEPSGDTVIAGQAEPNATVEIMDGPSVIATAEANETGEWVIALDQPLDPGTHDLAISTTTADESVVTLSDERVTVSVPEDGSADVLVVLNVPEAPSTVLQVPPVATPPAEQEVALAEPQAGATGQPAGEEEIAAAPEMVAEETPTDAAEPEAMAEAVVPEELEIASAAETAGAAEEPAVEAPAVDTAAAPESATEAAPAAPLTAATDEPAAAEAEQQVAIAPPATTEEVVSQMSTGTEPEIAGEEPIVVEPPVVAEAPAEIEPPPPVPMVTVAAVEADTTGALYVAGVAATGETVRVYIDDVYIDDAVPSPSGTWLVETIMDLPAGQYVVRADQVAADGSVVARYEVPFDREVEVAILKPTGATASTEGATLAAAMPEVDTVIIKRGDNLWRIARATWGKGIRWSTIYQANTDQIRNPHRIYPGQVFVMPKGDAAWQN